MSSNNSITSSNHLLINNQSHPIIKLPFPPDIDPLDLIPVKPSSPKATESNFKPTRAPNAFIIYRKAFVKAAREEGQCLPMTVISSMASSSWVQEPDVVKAEYKRIAKAAYLKRKELYPKERKRRRKEKWNIVSFDPQTATNNNNNTNDSNIINNGTSNVNNVNIVDGSNNDNIISGDSSNNHGIAFNITGDSNGINNNPSNNDIISDYNLLSPLSPLSLPQLSPAPSPSPISPTFSDPLGYSPPIDNYYNHDSLLSTPEISNFENIAFNETDNNFWTYLFKHNEQSQQISFTEFDNSGPEIHHRDIYYGAIFPTFNEKLFNDLP